MLLISKWIRSRCRFSLKICRSFTTLTNLQRAVGWDKILASDPAERQNLRNYIVLQLAAAGIIAPDDNQSDSMTEYSTGILESLREKNRLLSGYRAPVDSRIESFLHRYFHDIPGGDSLRLPSRSLTLDRHGMARELSLPVNDNCFKTELVSSYRCLNGVLNNPRADRRTTSWHVSHRHGWHGDSGRQVNGSKKRVRQSVSRGDVPSGRLDVFAIHQPIRRSREDMGFTLAASVGLSPQWQVYCESKTLETRVFAPGTLVSNLDFVESIFGNAGDPLSPQNDAVLDVRHWTGHTGCIVMAPHLCLLSKQELRATAF